MRRLVLIIGHNRNIHEYLLSNDVTLKCSALYNKSQNISYTKNKFLIEPIYFSLN